MVGFAQETGDAVDALFAQDIGHAAAQHFSETVFQRPAGQIECGGDVRGCALSDAVGGGALAVTGNLALEGATFEVAPANVSAPMLTVSGALALDGTLNIAIDPACVEGRDEITLATATGGVSGTPTAAGNIPSQWMLLARTNSLVLKKIKGTMLLVR